MGSANDLPVHAGTSPSMEVGREEQKEEEVFTKVNHPSTHATSHSNFTPLMPTLPMCGPTAMPGVTYYLNPAAPVFLPRPPDVSSCGLAWQQSSLQQACFPSRTWLRQSGFLGVEPWLCTTSVGPAFGVAVS